MVERDDFQRVEALLRAWGEIGCAESGHGCFPRRASIMGDGSGIRKTGAIYPLRPDAAECHSKWEMVERAMQSLAPTMRRLLRMKYRLGFSDELCRKDWWFTGMSDKDFRAMKGHAVELLALRLDRQRRRASGVMLHDPVA